MGKSTMTVKNITYLFSYRIFIFLQYIQYQSYSQYSTMIGYYYISSPAFQLTFGSHKDQGVLGCYIEENRKYLYGTIQSRAYVLIEHTAHPCFMFV